MGTAYLMEEGEGRWFSTENLLKHLLKLALLSHMAGQASHKVKPGVSAMGHVILLQ